jgi:hypothetical protein
VRITDVQADRFTLYVHEAPDMDGPHTTETVTYVVLEAGSWEVAGGVCLEVGTVSTNATVGAWVSNQWKAVTFPGDLTAAPVVLSQVQTNNDTHWVKTRQQNITASGFEVALEEEEAKKTIHGEGGTACCLQCRIIGWLAIEAGGGIWNNRPYQAMQTADAVTDGWYTILFMRPMQESRFVAALASYDEDDNAHLRYQNLTPNSVQVKVEEDTTYDTETGHSSEVVHYLALGASGPLTGKAYGATTTTTSYYYFNGQRVAMRKGGVVYWIASDHVRSSSGTPGYGQPGAQRGRGHGRGREPPLSLRGGALAERHVTNGLSLYGAAGRGPPGRHLPHGRAFLRPRLGTLAVGGHNCAGARETAVTQQILLGIGQPSSLRGSDRAFYGGGNQSLAYRAVWGSRSAENLGTVVDG